MRSSPRSPSHTILMVEYFQEVMATNYEIGITTEASVENSPKKASKSLVLNADRKTTKTEPQDKNIACRGDSEDNGKSNDLNDNLEYFEGLDLDDFHVDLDIDWDEFSRKHSRHNENRFEGIQF